MTFIEKYIRDKLGHPDSPPELDANDLWAGIESRLSPEEKERPVVKAFSWRGLALGLLLLFFAGGVWFLFPASSPEPSLAGVTPAPSPGADTNTGQPEVSTPAHDTAELIPSSGAETARTASALPETAALPANAQDYLLHPGTTDKTAQAGNDSRPEAGGQPQPSARADFEEASPAPPPPPKTTGPVQDDAAPKQPPVFVEGTAAEKTSVAPATAPAPPTTVAVPASGATTESIPPREPATVTEAVSKTTEESDEEPAEGAEEEAPVFKRSSGPRFSFGLYAGVNLLTRRYNKVDEGPGRQLNTASGAAAGVSISLALDYRLSGKLSVSSGAEYHRTLTPFDHTTVTDTMIAHPSEFNSGLINAVATRRTTHNHRLSILTVPLLINHKWTFGNFDLSTGAGIGLNFRQSATGKTLDASGLVVAYNTVSGSADVPDFFLSYRLRPALTWQPKPGGKLRFEFAGDISYQTFGASPLSGVKQSALLIVGNAGLRYGL